MNERIAKLYDQAIIIEDGGDYVCGELDPVKFAELIDRECANIATMNQFQYDAVGNYILKHFGVEQAVNKTLRNRSTYFGNDI
jgi:hypothetical protein